MERVINEIDSRISDLYYYEATREGMACFGELAENPYCLIDETDIRR